MLAWRGKFENYDVIVMCRTYNRSDESFRTSRVATVCCKVVVRTENSFAGVISYHSSVAPEVSRRVVLGFFKLWASDVLMYLSIRLFELNFLMSSSGPKRL